MNQGIGEWFIDNVITPVMLIVVLAIYWVRNQLQKLRM